MNFLNLAGMYYPEGVVKPGDTVVEIGSYDGKNLHESALFREDVTFHLFEPNPYTFHQLDNRFLAGGNVQCHDIAICEHDGIGDFYMTDPPGVGDSLYRHDKNLRQSTPVQTMILSTAFKMFHVGDIRLMLVNCEGAEYDIFIEKMDERLAPEWLSVSFHTDKHPLCNRQHFARDCVQCYLAATYETIAWVHPEKRCQQWIGKRRT